MLKEKGCEYSLLEKIYNALFYSALEYIHQLSMLSHVKYRNSNFTPIKEVYILSGTPMIKQNCSEYYLLEKIYNALFYSLLEYIKQLKCSLMKNTKIINLCESKNSKYYIGSPMLKTKLLWIYSVRKNTQWHVLLCFGVCKPTPYAVSCKIQIFYI